MLKSCNKTLMLKNGVLQQGKIMKYQLHNVLFCLLWLHESQILFEHIMLGKHFSRWHSGMFLFFSENRLWLFMQFVPKGDNLQEKSNLFSGKNTNIINLLSAEFAQRMVKVTRTYIYISECLVTGIYNRNNSSYLWLLIHRIILLWENQPHSTGEQKTGARFCTHADWSGSLLFTRIITGLHRTVLNKYFDQTVWMYWLKLCSVCLLIGNWCFSLPQNPLHWTEKRNQDGYIFIIASKITNHFPTYLVKMTLTTNTGKEGLIRSAWTLTVW